MPRSPQLLRGRMRKGLSRIEPALMRFLETPRLRTYLRQPPEYPPMIGSTSPVMQLEQDGAARNTKAGAISSGGLG